MNKFFALLSSVLIASKLTKGETITVNWIVPDNDDPVRLPDKFKVGDTLVFEWAGYHNVAIHPLGGCDRTDADILGSASPVSYTFTEEDVGSKVFACDVGDHCARGQIIEATVTSDAMTDMETETETEMNNEMSVMEGETITVNWIVPDTDDPVKFPEEFKVGDTLVFEWAGYHNVAIHPKGGCDRSDADLLGSTSPVSYKFTEEDVGRKVFACDVGDHCARGQIIEASISSHTMTDMDKETETEMDKDTETEMDKEPETEMDTETDKEMDKDMEKTDEEMEKELEKEAEKEVGEEMMGEMKDEEQEEALESGTYQYINMFRNTLLVSIVVQCIIFV